ncbi:MAG: SGNH/GDSL hydrolase family protein [Bacteroidetes bacterium]|nr:SGNH/GDSL hydrolase family protein [Bacteroidota bacterium]
MNLKYVLGLALSIPLLPLLYWQGKKVRRNVPGLPEAKGPAGISKMDSDAGAPLKLLILGESTMAGVGVENHSEGFAGTLAKELSRKLKKNIYWKVYAKSGYTARSLEKKLLPKLPLAPMDLIVIGLGGNDAFTVNTPGSWRKAIRNLITELRSRFSAAPIVFCSMPPIKEFPAFTPVIKWTIGNLVEILGDELDQEVKAHPDVYYDKRKLRVGDWIDKIDDAHSQTDFFSDGVHPSKLTYQTWARETALFIIHSQIIPN